MGYHRVSIRAQGFGILGSGLLRGFSSQGLGLWALGLGCLGSLGFVDTIWVVSGFRFLGCRLRVLLKDRHLVLV